MVDRVLVPADARMSQAKAYPAVEDSVAAVRTKLLVPRHLVPANAQMPQTKPSRAMGDSGAGSRRDLAVRRTLVPANAQIGQAANEPGILELRVGTAKENLFRLDEALLDKAFADDARKPVDWLISLGIHLAIVAVVMLIPLFITQAIDLGQFRYTYLVAPSLAAPSGPLPPPPPAAAARPQQAPRPQNFTAKLIAPIAIPKAIEMPRVAEEAPSEEAMGVPGGVVGGVPGGQIGGVLGGTLGGEGLPAPPPPVILTPTPPPVPSGPQRVGGQVKAPHVIFAAKPEYPPLAKQARVQGIVQIEAIIDEHGNVVQMKAVSGSGLLIPAAMRALAQWKYEPTYLNGEPYPVSLTVEVTFQM